MQERKFERVGGTETVSVDVRVIAATNRDLKREIEAKTFREDLFYRLGVIELHLPPLRERIADIPLLADHFLEKALTKHNLEGKFLSEPAIRSLLTNRFPGNVRELENIIERAAITADSQLLAADDLFPADRLQTVENSLDLLGLPFHEAIGALEKMLIQRALKGADYNKSEAAKLLGINRRLLYSKMEEHGL